MRDLAILCLCLSIRFTAPAGAVETIHAGRQPRIVSLSPSTTEVLFALGLGDMVVGVTRFCSYPEEAAKKHIVGGYLDPNYEAITALRADMVILLPEQREIGSFLDELGIDHMTVDNKTIDDIKETVRIIGGRFVAEAAADSILAGIEERIGLIRDATAGAARTSVLVVVGRSAGEGALRDVYVAGRGTYFDELIGYAGGVNACTAGRIPYPIVTAEGILAMDPDVVIDIMAGSADAALADDRLIADWRSLPGLRAAEAGRIHIVREGFANIPGPRFIDMLELLARFIHPEIAGEVR